MLSPDDLLKVDPLIKPEKKYQANPDADINAMLAALMGGTVGSALAGGSSSSITAPSVVADDPSLPQNSNGTGSASATGSVGDAAAAGAANGTSAAVGNSVVGSVAGLIGSVLGIPGIVSSVAINAITNAVTSNQAAAHALSNLDAQTTNSPANQDAISTNALDATVANNIANDSVVSNPLSIDSNASAVASVADAIDGNTSSPAGADALEGTASTSGDAPDGDADGDGGGGGGGSGCYLTTAILIATGKGDDADELKVMRKWRDSFARRYHAKLVNEYYRDAPAIVDAINDRKDAKEQWSKMYTEFLKPGVAAAHCEHNDLALNIYLRLVNHCKELAAGKP